MRLNIRSGKTSMLGATGFSFMKICSSSFSQEDIKATRPNKAIYFKKLAFIYSIFNGQPKNQGLVIFVLLHIGIGGNLITRYGINIEVTGGRGSFEYAAFPLPMIAAVGKLTKTNQVGTTLRLVIKLTASFGQQEFGGQLPTGNVATGITKGTLANFVDVCNSVVQFIGTEQGFGTHQIGVGKAKYRKIGTGIGFAVISGSAAVGISCCKFINPYPIITT